MEQKESRKQRLNPSKLLVLLLYGTYPYMRVEHLDDDTKKVTINGGKFAKLMRVRKTHLMEYLSWLDQMGFIVLVSKDKYTVTFNMYVPTLFKEVSC